MESNIYKKVLEQIKKYNLESDFKNMDKLNEWALSLNELQINNFLSVNVPFNNSQTYILCDKDFLSSKYFQHDVKLIASAKSDTTASQLIWTALNSDSLQSKYHESDMKLIAKADTEIKVEQLGETSRSFYSLSKEYHPRDMELIFNAKTDIIVGFLGDISRFYYSLESKYYKTDRELIANAKSDIIATQLWNTSENFAVVSPDNPSYKNYIKHHESDMELIANAKSDTIAKCLGDMSRYPASLQNENHEINMKWLANVQTDEQAEELVEILENRSSKSEQAEKKVEHNAKLKTDDIANLATELFGILMKINSLADQNPNDFEKETMLSIIIRISKLMENIEPNSKLEMDNIAAQIAEINDLLSQISNDFTVEEESLLTLNRIIKNIFE